MLPAYNTEEGETADWRQTAEKCENKRQKDAKMNWNSWQLRNRKQKNLSNFQKQTFIQVYKYIQQCLSKIYRSWKRKEAKRNWNKTRMRRIKKEKCRHRKLQKQERITKAEYKGKEQKRKCKKWEMQKWYTNAENEWRKICRVQI